MIRHRVTFALVFVGILLVYSMVAGAAELEMWECWGDSRTEWIKGYIAAFEKEHPGITVNLTTMGCHEIADKFLVAYLGGVAPDLVMFQTFDIVAFADQGMLHPIDAYME